MLSLPGIWSLLRRLDIHWVRGRDHLHSPDEHYQVKLQWVQMLQTLAQSRPEQHVLLWQDELTYYRQPSLGQAYAWAGHEQPLAERSYRANTPVRVVAALDNCTGAVYYRQAARISVPILIDFYAQLCTHYPGRQLWLVQDNWPVHCHPRVLAALERQETPFSWHLPRSWRGLPALTPSSQPLPIQLVMLPTYAPWSNPIEKLRRWLKQDIIHLHRWADDLNTLRYQVALFLDQFAPGSTSLLRYVGLPVPS